VPYHHGDLRNDLIAATRELLSDGRMPSIREAARRVGVSANAPYRHFADRDALLRGVAAAGYRDAAARLAGRTGARSVAAAWQSLASAEPGLVELMTSRGLGSDDGLEAAVTEWLGEVARAVEGEIGTDDPEAVLRAAVAVWAVVHGRVSLERAGLLARLDSWMLPAAEEMAAQVKNGQAGG